MLDVEEVGLFLPGAVIKELKDGLRQVLLEGNLARVHLQSQELEHLTQTLDQGRLQELTFEPVDCLYVLIFLFLQFIISCFFLNTPCMLHSVPLMQFFIFF